LRIVLGSVTYCSPKPQNPNVNIYEFNFSNIS